MNLARGTQGSSFFANFRTIQPPVRVSPRPSGTLTRAPSGRCAHSLGSAKVNSSGERSTARSTATPTSGRSSARLLAAKRDTVSTSHRPADFAKRSGSHSADGAWIRGFRGTRSTRGDPHAAARGKKGAAPGGGGSGSCLPRDVTESGFEQNLANTLAKHCQRCSIQKWEKE